MVGFAVGVDAAGMRKTYERNKHEELIRAVARRREPVRSAAARLGVSMSTAYRWVRATGGADAARGATTAAAAFMELVPASARTAVLVVRVRAVEIEVRAGFDAPLLQAVVAALTEATA